MLKKQSLQFDIVCNNGLDIGVVVVEHNDTEERIAVIRRYTQTPLIRTPLIRARLSTGRDLTRREQGQTASIRPRLLARGGDWFQRRGIYRRDIHSVGEPSPLLLPQAPTTAQDQAQVHIYTYWDTTVY